MSGELKGKKIAILAADGVEQVELEDPRKAVEEAGAETELLSIEAGEIQAVEHDIEPTEKVAVDKTVADASVDDYDGLILPGGVGNPDKLRKEEAVIDFLQAWFKTGKPVGVICHGPWTLVEADLVRGRTLTSYPSIRTDIRNAGGNVVDEEVVTDQGLVSSRDPDDLPAFCAKIVEEFAEGAHDVADATAAGRSGVSRQDNIAAQEHLADNINSGDIAAAVESFAVDCVDHDPAPDQEPGRDGFVTFFTALKKGFPDAKLAPDRVVADDDHVAVAYTLSGTHEGEFQGVAPTHRRIAVRGVQIGRFEDGKIVERWGASDELGILRQLGTVPDPT